MLQQSAGKKRFGSIFVLMLLFILLSFSLSSLRVLAESSPLSPVSVLSVVNQIKPSEVASFKVTITNPVTVVQRYTLYSLQVGQGWDIEASPIHDKIVELEPGKSYTVLMKIRAVEELPPGVYAILLSVDSDLGEKQTVPLKVYLSPEYAVDYLPSIHTVIDMDEKINPQKPLSVKLFLENKNPLNLTGLTVKVTSDMSEFQKEFKVDLPPLEKKTLEFTIIPSEIQQPKEYTLFFVFEKEGQVVKVVEKKVAVETIASPFVVDVAYDTFLLKKFGLATITNKGNVLNEQKVRVPVSFWEYLVAGGVESRVRDTGGFYLEWTRSLAPHESLALPFVINYRIYLYFVLFVVLFVVFYVSVQSPVVIKKRALVTQVGEEGALSEIKVTLDIVNRKNKPLKNLVVHDEVPAIAHVERGADMGTLKPDEIKHLGGGTRISWHISELDGEEERLITYKVRAKLDILGELDLPRAGVEYKKKGLASKSYSNGVRLGGGK